METKKFADDPVNGAEERLKQLGYRQELQRGLSASMNVVMGLSNVSPVMAAFTYALAAFATVGTATAGGTLLQCINVFCIGMILAELGSIYPVSGGLYSITRYVLPKPLVFLGVFNFVIQAFIYIPAIAMGVGTYMQILFPQLPQGPLACSVISALSLMLALFIGLNSIVTNSRVTVVFLIVQMIIVFVFWYICFANPQRSLGEVLFRPQMLSADGMSIEPADFASVLMGLGIMCAAIDGYGASLGFSEETKGSCRTVGKAVFATAFLTLFFVGLCDIISMVSAPDLLSFLQVDSPAALCHQFIHGANRNHDDEHRHYHCIIRMQLRARIRFRYRNHDYIRRHECGAGIHADCNRIHPSQDRRKGYCKTDPDAAVSASADSCHMLSLRSNRIADLSGSDDCRNHRGMRNAVLSALLQTEGKEGSGVEGGNRKCVKQY